MQVVERQRLPTRHARVLVHEQPVGNAISAKDVAAGGALGCVEHFVADDAEKVGIGCGEEGGGGGGEHGVVGHGLCGMQLCCSFGSLLCGVSGLRCDGVLRIIL